MQTTANIWDLLCKDLQAEQSKRPATEYPDAAKKFTAAAAKILRPDSPRLGDAIEIAGDICEAGAMSDLAADYFRRALEHAERLTNCSAAARLALKMAYLREGQQELDSARRYYLRAMQHYETARDYSYHVKLLLSLAAMLDRADHRQEAEDYFQQALDTAARLHGRESPPVADALTRHGLALFGWEEFVRAENSHMQAMSLRERNFGPVHPDVAESLANLGAVYHSQCEFEKAHRYYRAALKIYKRYKEPDSPELATLRGNMRLLEETTGQRITL